MKRSSRRLVASAAPLAVIAAACGATRRTPPAPEAASPPPATAAADSGFRRYTEADARFMQRMMGHHAQALTMTALVPTHSSREDIRRLAERIAASQDGEIAMMRQWLTKRGQQVPSLDASHHEHHGAAGHEASMPGMLTPDELARLTGASGAEFDRLFLDYMIRHHQGALTMVAEFLGTQGAGQEPEIFRFASDVDADQRAEIARLRALQAGPPAGAPPR